MWVFQTVTKGGGIPPLSHSLESDFWEIGQEKKS